MSTNGAVTYAKEKDIMIEMNYRNAVVGKVIEVSQRPWDSTNRRQVAIECCDPFKFTTTLVWVHNYEDAMMMVDRMVCVYDGELYPLEVGGE
jgi:hypothetical protein